MLWLMIAIGGAAGAMARYAATIAVTTRVGTAATFPLGTFVVNGVGCLLAGMLLAVASRTPMSNELRAMVGVGFLGGFTTFSAFGVETFVLLQNGQTTTALSYMVASLAIAAPAVWAGYTVVAN